MIIFRSAAFTGYNKVFNNMEEYKNHMQEKRDNNMLQEAHQILDTEKLPELKDSKIEIIGGRNSQKGDFLIKIDDENPMEVEELFRHYMKN